MSRFAVIDTETTWRDDVMSIGAVVAESETLMPVDSRYYILTPFKDHGGMYSHAMYAKDTRPDKECARDEAMHEMMAFLSQNNVRRLFAYNANFDFRHLPELHGLEWYDILKVAAYRQHNPKITDRYECCATGRLKKGYKVEDIYRMLSGDADYHETHNALTDAVDELALMCLLGRKPEQYKVARIH